MIPKDSEKSKQMAAVALEDTAHREERWVDIAKEVGISASRTTVEKAMHEQHKLNRYKPIDKPPLNEQNCNERLQLANWGIHIPIDYWVFSDECYIEMNVPRKKRKITRPIGSNPYDYAEHNMKNTSPSLRIMVWGCIAYGHKGPLFIWNKESSEEKQFYRQMVAAENQVKRERQTERQRRALQEGTKEYDILTEINTNIQKLDQENPLPSGYPRRKRRAEWEFKEEIMERGDRSNGGIDWILYREKILRPLLYPFLQQLTQDTGHEMWLVEDNAPAHKTCKRLEAEERKKYGIRTVIWPANSPDANKIEPL